MGSAQERVLQLEGGSPGWPLGLEDWRVLGERDVGSRRKG